MAGIKPLFLLFATFSLSALTSSSESHSGRWKVLKKNLGISAMHMALLPNGKVVAFDRTEGGPSNISLPPDRCRGVNLHDGCTAHSVEFDPSNRVVRPLIIRSDTFCSGGALLPNGTLIQIGGDKEGNRSVRHFSPCQGCDWTEDITGLMVRRWYATDQILPDERIVVVGGAAQFNYEFVPKSSTPDRATFKLPFLYETYSHIPHCENNLYPFVHLLPDGNLFVFANNKSILLDYVNHIVVKEFTEMPGGIARNYPSTGSSVLLPLRLDEGYTSSVRAEVMVCGGTISNAYLLAHNDNNKIFVPASSTCGRLTITDEFPEWEMEEMPIRRIMGDMVLLPTGDVLIINGAMNGSAGWRLAREPALSPVIYRTGVTSVANRTFEVLSPTGTPRLYHSTALLIPDGRVLIGGSNPNSLYEFTKVMYPTELSLEAFYPPYLSPSIRRPDINSVSPELEFRYGDRILVGFSAKKMPKGQLEGGGAVRVSMVAPSFNTHSFTMNQRMLVLRVLRVQHIVGWNYTAEVSAPPTATLAPPGYYMLFVVHGGVPSKGFWIRIRR